MKTPHTSVYRGKRVMVKLHDGSTFIDQFIENDSLHLHFKSRSILRKQLKWLKIVKGESNAAII